MKIFCRLSGTEFEVRNSFGNLRTLDVHPLFNCTLPTILAQLPQWMAGKLDERNRRILFLALLYKTDLVHFKITPQPSDSIVQQNMEAAAKVASWKDALSNELLFNILPQYIISHQTKDLSNIKSWFDMWFDAQENWRENFKTEHHKAKLAKREEILLGYIHSPQKNKTAYVRNLADWTMTACKVPEALREYWTKLFFLSGIDVYKKEYSADLDKLVEHMEKYLQPYFREVSLIAMKAIAHVRELRAKNIASINYGLGMIDDAQEAEDFASQLQDQPFKIVTDTVEEHNKKIAISIAPLEEPKERDYPTKLAFLLAKSAFTLAIQQREKMQKFEDKQLSLELRETLDAISNEEDSSIAESIDLSMKIQKGVLGDDC